MAGTGPSQEFPKTQWWQLLAVKACCPQAFACAVPSAWINPPHPPGLCLDVPFSEKPLDLNQLSPCPPAGLPEGGMSRCGYGQHEDGAAPAALGPGQSWWARPMQHLGHACRDDMSLLKLPLPGQLQVPPREGALGAKGQRLRGPLGTCIQT